MITSIFLLLFLGTSWAQTLGGFVLSDHLVTVEGPDCFPANPEFVTAYPNDSLWVNLNDYDTITGYFSSGVLDQPGADLLLETGFHPVNYQVRCILLGGGFSSVLNVALGDWDEISTPLWTYVGQTCAVNDWVDEQLIVDLDFQSDFGLMASEEVIGIEIVVQPTPGNPDFAGAYLIGPPCTATSSQMSVEVCNSYTSPSGNYTWTTSGSYEDTITNAEGCDSVIYIGLVVSGSLDADAALITGSTIEASPSGASYQWVTCPGFIPIPGANDLTFTATIPGEYAVIITQDACVDTSECVLVNQVDPTSISETGIDIGIRLYPNPATDKIELRYPEGAKSGSITLYDLTGNPVIRKKQLKKSLDLKNLDAGTYYLILEIEGEHYFRAFQKYK